MTDHDMRTVLLRDEDWALAKSVRRIFRKPRELATLLRVPLEELWTLFSCVECQHCGATYGEKCLTSAGDTADPHAPRVERLLAVMSAIQHETVIHEEEHIEDLLA